MFTGIISKTSKVKDIDSKKGSLYLQIENNIGKVKLGESISINGVCSTVKSTGKNLFFEYMPETLRLTNIGLLKKGDVVNIEKSMVLGDSLSGHLVLGHIDGTGKIVSIKKEGNSQVFEISPVRGREGSQRPSASNGMKFLVYKGSVAIEGISLTVTKVSKGSFFVKILPYTLMHTNLKDKQTGDAVNLEFDILAKYANKR
jgi:riboflavin synthase